MCQLTRQTVCLTTYNWYKNKIFCRKNKMIILLLTVTFPVGLNPCNFSTLIMYRGHHCDKLVLKNPVTSVKDSIKKEILETQKLLSYFGQYVVYIFSL